MAHSLYITYSGGTVNLNSGNIRMLEQYVPRMGNGETTVDSVELEFSGTAVSVIHDSIQAINVAMGEAAKFTKDGLGSRVYAYYQPDGYTEAWRSELVPEDSKNWKIDLANDAMSKARWNDAIRVKGVLAWTRKDYWEGTLTPFYPYNTNGTVGFPLVLDDGDVFNCGDGSSVGGLVAENWLNIDSSRVTGELQTPIKLQVEPYVSETMVIDTYYIGMNHYKGGTAWLSHVEAEAYTSAASGAAKVADATASGGTVVSVPIPPGANTELLKWTGSRDLFTTFNNQTANIFIVFGGTVTTSYIEDTKYAIRFNDPVSGGTILTTDYMYVHNHTINPLNYLLSIQLPPGALALTGNYFPDSFTFSLLARQDTSGTLTPKIDYLQFFPADSYREYQIPVSGKSLMDDIYEDGVYSVSPTGHAFPLVKLIGDQLELIPGQNQRLYFMAGGTATSANAHAHFTVKGANYRPRRRLI